MHPTTNSQGLSLAHLVSVPRQDAAGVLLELAQGLRDGKSWDWVAERLHGVDGLPNGDAYLALAPGGYELCGQHFELIGMPRQMLAALLAARWRRLDALRIAERMGMNVDDSFQDQDVVRHAAKRLRKSLREACQAVGIVADNPLPSSGVGAELNYVIKIAIS